MSVLLKFIGLIASCILILLIVGTGPAVWLWDRQPSRPAWTQSHLLWLHWPDWIRAPSLAAQDAYDKAQLVQANANVQVLRTAIDGQNTSIARLSAEGTAATAVAEKAVQHAQQVQGAASRLEANIKALPPVTKADDCPALDLSDQVFVGYLKTVRP